MGCRKVLLKKQIVSGLSSARKRGRCGASRGGAWRGDLVRRGAGISRDGMRRGGRGGGELMRRRQRWELARQRQRQGELARAV